MYTFQDEPFGFPPVSVLPKKALRISASVSVLTFNGSDDALVANSEGGTANFGQMSRVTQSDRGRAQGPGPIAASHAF
jgi:hypothetical protein